LEGSEHSSVFLQGIFLPCTLSAYDNIFVQLWAQYQTVVAVFVANLSASTIQNVQVYIEAPSGFTIGFDKDPQTLTVDGSTVTIPTLASGGSAAIVSSFTCSSNVLFVL
jgi:hypothetical protein